MEIHVKTNESDSSPEEKKADEIWKKNKVKLYARVMQTNTEKGEKG